jgi:hypothetical protein
MPLIECKLGPVETNVAGHNYSFQRDVYGRAVAEVHPMEHQICFLAVEHYRLVPDVPETAPEPVIENALAAPAAPPNESAPVVPLPSNVPVETPTAPETAEPIEPVAPAPAAAAVVLKPAKKKGGRPSKKSLTGE